MTNRSNPSIFRTEALQRYMQRHESQVLPRIIAPRTFALLWLILGLLAVSVGLAWLVRIPVHAFGSAVVVDDKNQDQPGDGRATLVAFFPPDSFPHLREGQDILVQFGGDRERLQLRIIEVESDITSPQAARERFGLDTTSAAAVAQPAAVAVAQLETTPGGLLPSRYVGSVLRAEVEVGSRRILSLFKSTLPALGE